MRRSPVAFALAAASFGAGAEAQEVNLYSSRHYDTDLALYENFTKETGIRVNLIEGEADQLLERIVSEGANSPADILVTVDGGRLYRAVEAGVLSPVESALLEERVPAKYQHPDNLWFGLTTRVRVIYYDKSKGVPEGLDDYEDLADPSLKGEVCIRTSSNIYNVSLMSELIEIHGEDAAQKWAEGLKANLARDPQGGDTDQIKAVAAGECRVGVGNNYYWARLAGSSKPEDVAIAEKVGLIFPNQTNRGAHANVSGAGVVKTAPNRENAVKFLEYLVSDEAQEIFALGNNEFPVVEGIAVSGPMAEYSEFKVSGVNAAMYGENAEKATQVWDRAGMP